MSSEHLSAGVLDPDEGTRELAWTELVRKSVLWSRDDIRLVQSEISAELARCLEPEVHEKQIRPYGAIVCAQAPAGVRAAGHTLATTLADDALRSFADGRHAFTLIARNEAPKLFLVDQPQEHDDDLASCARDFKGVVVCNDARGVVRLVTASSVTTIEGRRWSSRQLLSQLARELCHLVPAADATVVAALLRLCQHRISRTGRGGMLLYVLTDQDDGSRYRDRGLDVRDLRLSVLTPTHQALIAHQIRYRDGAAVVGPDGALRSVNSIIAPSARSESAIEPFSGTRHTAAARHTYDCPDMLAFVVSADRWVTVFTDGRNIADLTDSPRRAGEAGDAVIDFYRRPCPQCGATLMIEVSISEVPEGNHDERASCPVCGALAAQERCWFIKAAAAKTRQTIRAMLATRRDAAPRV